MEEKKKDIIEQVKEEVRKELEKKAEPQKEVRKPQEPQFINHSRNRFIKIDSEVFREYLYQNGAKITIEQPLLLSIDKSGVHRVFDGTGVSYYIPLGWIAIASRAKPGAPNFIL